MRWKHEKSVPSWTLRITNSAGRILYKGVKKKTKVVFKKIKPGRFFYELAVVDNKGERGSWSIKKFFDVKKGKKRQFLPFFDREN